ncbi:sugar ABC transporter permease [Cohnella endophytica]|uniref:Sugar ABC transporter permease n=1 Tax=Cohnella endophytica TaxID=2419778 RepID=A0A494Y1Q9_9BACL|nr:sugar ABC transporter permease [Cohnella endophytica]RKP56181.1 sugar ABC transporter permease [Cohnella endophytica]
MRKALKQYAQVSPYLVVGLALTLAFVLYPMAKGMYISFFHYNVIKPETSESAGLSNFKHVFTDPMIGTALRNSLLMAIVTVPGQWIAGIVLALLIQMKTVRLKVFWRLIYYVPVISSWIVVSYLFRFLFADGHEGMINYLLVDILHLIGEPIGWLQNTGTANLVVWLVSIWKGAGWVMVLYLAALQSIPRSLYEAAEIDGARPAAAFLNITLPLVRPLTAYVIINLVNGAIQAFIQVYAITQGGPMDSTQLLNTYLYKQAFQYFDFGYASAISVCLGVLIFALTYTQQRSIGRDRIEF